jgi:hypothetical protein
MQSSTLLLMAARGELAGGTPDAAIFADTGWEPAAVYRWRDWLEEQVRGVIPVHRVTAGNIRDAVYTAKSTGARYATLPLYVLGRDGKKGRQKRQCTREFKIAPQVAHIRGLLGLIPGRAAPHVRADGTLSGSRRPWAGPVQTNAKRTRTYPVLVEQWFGISLDEVGRMKDTRHPYIAHRYPLIDLGWTRDDCLAWWDRAGLPRPPKSACIGCPFRRNREWQRMKDEAPSDFADAVAFDHAIRAGQRGLRGQAFVHDSRLPLDEVDFASGGWTGQGRLFDTDFADECEGMCGV